MLFSFSWLIDTYKISIFMINIIHELSQQLLTSVVFRYTNISLNVHKHVIVITQYTIHVLLLSLYRVSRYTATFIGIS